MVPFIPFPRQCSEKVEDYKYTIRCYSEALYSCEPVRVECGDCRFFRPFGINLLTSLIHSLQLHDCIVYFTPPKDASALQYLADQGFFTEFAFQSSGHPLRRNSRSTSVVLRVLNDFDGSYLMQIAHWLTANSSIPREAARDIVAIPLPEIINNVFDHSGSLIGCCISAQAYPREKQLMFSVTDLGVGFLKNLLLRYPQLNCEKDAIDLAVQLGVSSKSRSSNCGAGLDILTGWLRTHHGEIEIISYDGLWKQGQDGHRSRRTLSFAFPGTCINLCIHTDPLLESNSTLEYQRYD